MAREFAPLPQRMESAIYRLEKIPTLLRQTREELQPARVPVPHAATYAAQNPGLKSIVTGMIEPHKGVLSASKQRRLERAIAAFNAAVDEHQAWITGNARARRAGRFPRRRGNLRHPARLHAALQPLAPRHPPAR
jgi:hypothetical protein